MAGTLLHLQRAGYEIHYMNVANGCCGSTVYGRDELAHMRREEAIEACRFVGSKFPREPRQRHGDPLRPADALSSGFGDA